MRNSALRWPKSAEFGWIMPQFTRGTPDPEFWNYRNFALLRPLAGIIRKLGLTLWSNLTAGRSGATCAHAMCASQVIMIMTINKCRSPMLYTEGRPNYPKPPARYLACLGPKKQTPPGLPRPRPERQKALLSATPAYRAEVATIPRARRRRNISSYPNTTRRHNAARRLRLLVSPRIPFLLPYSESHVPADCRYEIIFRS